MSEFVQLPISKLKFYEKNPRKITKDQFEKLCKNMLADPEFLDKRPVLVSHTADGLYLVYAGNQRVRAAKKLGWKTISCIVDTELSEEVIKRRVVLDNVHHGEFDFDMLADTYDPIDLLELGFTENQLNYFIDKDTEEEDNNKPKKLCPHCGGEL